MNTANQTPPLLSRFNAWFLATFDGLADHYFSDRKRTLFADLPDTIVEIGPGTGANFRYYRPGTEVLAVEPNAAMHPRLRRSAARWDIALEIRAESAEHISLDDDSAPAVVSTLVLCTVADPRECAAELKRILEPGGRLVFLEHVAADGRVLRMIQRLLERPWRFTYEGCELRRGTAGVLEASGFRRVEFDRYLLKSIFVPINSQIAGVAIK